MAGEIHSRAATKEKDITRTGNGTADVAQGEQSLGEKMGPSAVHRTAIREWPNQSLNRNGGPMHPSANTGMLPVPDQSVRKTGRI
jgi:hypothetical protein